MSKSQKDKREIQREGHRVRKREKEREREREREREERRGESRYVGQWGRKITMPSMGRVARQCTAAGPHPVANP